MQRTVTYDDLDGTTEASTTIRFSIDDDFMELDLSDEHADDFTKALAPFVAAARTYSPATSARKPGMTKDERATIKTWADKNGIEVSDRGRIPSSVIEAYKESLTPALTNEPQGEHATVEQIEQAMKAGEQSTQTAPEQEPETPAGEPTSTSRGRRRS